LEEEAGSEYPLNLETPVIEELNLKSEPRQHSTPTSQGLLTNLEREANQIRNLCLLEP
jgi:hypothetical protein